MTIFYNLFPQRNQNKYEYSLTHLNDRCSCHTQSDRVVLFEDAKKELETAFATLGQACGITAEDAKKKDFKVPLQRRAGQPNQNISALPLGLLHPKP